MTSLSSLSIQWAALSPLLDEALALPAAARAGWLDALDGERAAHRDALRALLATQAGIETGDFLGELPRLPAPEEAGMQPVPGARVGPYRLIERVGEGGMGTVWLAERADGAMTRRVALKLPRRVWGDAFAARLARERDILAALEHAHIARLYDAGIDAEDRPYLAMAYVEGEPIDAWCSRRASTLRERVRLLLQTMAAVSHAHARLVVHRDLKPGNILVTAAGETMLLDFGIAGLLRDEATDPAAPGAFTAMSGRALTPAYASPEQLRGESLGTASDVYSLAVVACELLAGARPYRPRRPSAAALEEAILVDEPARASDVATTPATARALRGDLDAILAKAMKKSAAARYASMDAFAQDLRRWLDGAPVLARPDGWRYRAAKFVARHRWQVAGAAVAVAALVVASSVALWQAGQARLQARRAIDEAVTARAAQDFLEDVFRLNGGDSDDPERARRTTARELLDRGAQRIDAQLKDAPAARWQLLGTLAAMYDSMALLDQAADLQRRRVALARSAWGADSPQVAAALAALAHALALLDRRGEANEVAEAATRMLQRLDGPASPAGRSGAASSSSAGLDRLIGMGTPARYDLAMARALVGQREDAAAGLAAAGEAIANARQRHADGDLVRALQVRSETASSEGDEALARDDARAAIALIEKDPARGGHQLSALYVALADALFGLDDLDGADAAFRRSLVLADERNASSPIYRHTAERRYGSFLRRNGRFRDSVAMHRPGAEWARANPSGFGTVPAMLVAEYGRALVAYGRAADGLTALDESLAMATAPGIEAPETTAGIHLFRGQALLDLGHLEAARAEAARAHAFFDGGQAGPAPALAALDRALAVKAGHAGAALQAWQAERAGRKRPPEPLPSERVRTWLDAAALHLAAGQAGLAADQARIALARVQADPARAWQVDLEASAEATLGQALLAAGRGQEARAPLARALQLTSTLQDPRSPVVAERRAAQAKAGGRPG